MTDRVLHYYHVITDPAFVRYMIEHAGLMGVPIPAPIVSAIDILKQRAGE